MRSDSAKEIMKHWKITGYIATVVIVFAFPIYLVRIAIERSAPEIQSGPFFTGRESCVECHKKENDLWLGSHHDMAMDTASDESVLGDFNNVEFKHKGLIHRMFRKNGGFYINTEGPDGKFSDFQIAYTFGYTPLQQYLIPFEGGKLQCLPIAWDTDKEKWFHLGDTLYTDEDLKPDSWLYWTNQAQNWNGMCADCHSTNLRKNYDTVTETFSTQWSEIDVSCEACHGPASEHLQWANLPEGSRPMDVNTGLIIRTRDLDNQELLNVCARCHSRRSVMGDYPNDNEDLQNHIIPQLILQPAYHADGQILDEDYVYGSFTQSKMYEKEIRCNECHDSHSLKTLEDDNKLCLICHRPDIYDSPTHHFHKMPVEGGKHLINRDKPEYVEGTGSQCVNCHMVGKFYMGNDYRRDHSFRIPRPDLTLSIGTPNACNDCHTDKTVEWSQTYIEKWYGEKKRPHYGETFAAAHEGDPKAVPNLVLYAENELFPLMVRATAVSLLGNYDDSISRGVIERALGDPYSLIRYTAVNAYIPRDAQSLEKTMAPLLNDPVKAVRTQAAFQLSVLPENNLSEAVKKARNAATEEYKNVNLYMSDFPGARHNLGILYGNSGDLENAASSYRSALKIDNLFYSSKVNLAMIYAQQGKNADAEKLLREVIRDHPEAVQVNYSLALLLAQNGKFSESRKYFLEAIKILEGQPRILYNYALFENSQGNIGIAEEYLLKAYNSEPGNYDFIYALCTFYLEHNQKTKAVVYANLLIELFPQNPVGKQLLEMSSN
ncbi:MAG: tetratricopeptide repeat protein [Bacteroidales bacterium]|nr:tetratricopeptide repeat protein [Bacteroidales bacterium]MCF8391549.1 tetratricopeptide repeat protein [Bacteroidales bacterium]